LGKPRNSAFQHRVLKEVFELLEAEEAATELAGHVPAAREAETWFYRETHRGNCFWMCAKN
jgi:hypothetical protein